MKRTLPIGPAVSPKTLAGPVRGSDASQCSDRSRDSTDIDESTHKPWEHFFPSEPTEASECARARIVEQDMAFQAALMLVHPERYRPPTWAIDE